MEYIIQSFLENVTKKIKKSSFSDIVNVINYESKNFGKEFIIFLLEKMDKNIRESEERKRNWSIERYDKRTIHTEIGAITFTRTYYVHKRKCSEGTYKYLLDESLGIRKYQRLDVRIEAKLIDLANDLSFEKTGNLAFDDFSFSKQTVKNKVAKFSKKDLKEELPEKKKKVKYLYIDTDEDHPSLQNGKNKWNKIIYVYEGKVKESKNRNFLLNRRVFASFRKSSDDLWLDVLDYLYENYDLDYIKKIFIQGDGASWIKKGIEWIDKSVYVLDQFHLNKALRVLTGGRNKDYNILVNSIYNSGGDKKEFLKLSKEILEKEKEVKKYENKNKKRNYVKNQWKGIVAYLENRKKHKLGCSAEGHVSHILASRMSSRPMGWSKSGIEAMTKLRVKKENGLTRKQIIETLGLVDKEIIEGYKLKNMKRIKKKTGEVLNNIPILKIGKVGSLQKLMNCIKYA